MHLSHVENKVKETLSKITKQDLENCESDIAMGSIIGWDSIGHLSLLQQLSDHFKKEVPFELITELTSTEKIISFFSDS
jgi:acyl carrier protein